MTEWSNGSLSANALGVDVSPRTLVSDAQDRALAAGGAGSVRHDSATIMRVARVGADEGCRVFGSAWGEDVPVQVIPGGKRPLTLKANGYRSCSLMVNAAAALRGVATAQGPAGHANPLTVIENAAGILGARWMGHYAVCPMDQGRHERLIWAAVEGVQASCLAAEDTDALAELVAEFFEESLIVAVMTVAEGRQFVEGLVAERLLNSHKQTLLARLQACTQAILFPHTWTPPLLTALGAEDPLATALAPCVIPIVLGSEVCFTQNAWGLASALRIPIPINWPLAVKKLAELLAPYVKPDLDEPDTTSSTNPFGGISLGGIAPSGAPAPSPPQVDALPHPSLLAPNAISNGNPAPNRTLAPGSAGRPSPPVDFSSLDQYYTKQACALPIHAPQAGGHDKRQHRLRVGYLTTKPASLLDVLSGPIAWSKTRRVRKSPANPLALQFWRKSEPLCIQTEGPENASAGLPHLCLILDTSGSMGRLNQNGAGNPPASGRLHIALTASWNILHYVQSVSRHRNAEIVSVNFSHETRSSGWRPSSDLEPVKRNLGQPQSGGTVLDVQVLRRLFDECPGQFLAVMMTDGQIKNTPTALDAFAQTIAAGNRVALFHIGSAENAFTRGMKELGCLTHIVRRPEELLGLTLDVVQSEHSLRHSP